LSGVQRGPRRGRTVHSSAVGWRVVEVVSARRWPSGLRRGSTVALALLPRESIFLGGGGEKQSTATTTCAAAEGVLLCAAQVVLCSNIADRGWPPVSWGAEPRPWRVSPLSPPPRRRPLLPSASAPSRTRWCVSESSNTSLFLLVRCGMPNMYDLSLPCCLSCTHWGPKHFGGERKKERRAQTGCVCVCVCARAHGVCAHAIHASVACSNTNTCP